jgi:iron(III) transport system ATP-binding protein
MNPMLRVRRLVKSFATESSKVQLAVDTVSFDVNEGDFFTLLGPSGCGKSTILRCIAGLETPDSGTISIGGEVVSSADVFYPPNERPISMVFQSYAIWPHMTVLENVAFPLSYRAGPDGKRLPRKEHRERAVEALRLVQLDHLADRRAPYLSGGQQQRVALARGLVGSPQLMLLDEPLSNLDASLRAEMRSEIKELTARLGITTLYVTHDQGEALSMSDRIAVMAAGHVIQMGSPREIYLSPVTSSVARIAGAVNVLTGRLIPSAGGSRRMRTAGGAELDCRVLTEPEQGGMVEVLIRPELIDVSSIGERVSDADELERNFMSGTVQRLLFSGDHVECVCDTTDGPISARLTPDRELHLGQPVTIEFRAGLACRPVAPEQ